MGQPILLRIIEKPHSHEHAPGVECRCPKIAPQPGDMWRLPEVDFEGREAWMIVLPNRGHWYTTLGMQQGKGWDVTGTAPHITVSPSVLAHADGLHAEWHGWIRDGMLVDV